MPCLSTAPGRLLRSTGVGVPPSPRRGEVFGPSALGNRSDGFVEASSALHHGCGAVQSAQLLPSSLALLRAVSAFIVQIPGSSKLDHDRWFPGVVLRKGTLLFLMFMGHLPVAVT